MKKAIYFLPIVFLFLIMCNSKREIEEYKNGQIKYKVSLDDNGKRAGEMVEYYSNGELKSISNWLNGSLKGDFKEFYKNGKIKKTGNFLNGNPNGKIEYYYKSGDIEHIEIFEEGSLIDFYYYDTLGNLRSDKMGIGIEPKFDEIDTIKKNSNVEIGIRVFNKLYKNTELIIGKFDEEDNLIDTIDIILPNSKGMFPYKLISDSLGWNSLRGSIYIYSEIKPEGEEGKEIIVLPFQFDYFVKRH